MRYLALILAGSLSVTAACIAADEPAALTLAEAQPLYPPRLNVTGRVQAMVSARLSPRISGHLVEFGKNDAGQMLDAGMEVKAGQLLFRINQTTFSNGLAMAEAGLKSAQASLANLTAKTREERLDALRQGIAELDTRIATRQHDEERFRRLVEVEKTLPATRLEEVQSDLGVLRVLKKAAEARLREAENGPTPSEIAVAEARVQEAQVAVKIAQDDLRDTAVRAPFDGVITRRFKSPGDYLTAAPPSDVLELVAQDRLEAELWLPEAYFGSIKAGTTPVTLHSPLLDSDLAVPVTRIIPDIDPAKGTFAVRVAIAPDRRGKLAPGAFVTGDVDLRTGAMGVIIPQRALVQTADETVVFLAEGGKMVRRSVEVGDRLTEGVVIKSGITAGQKVIIGPAELLHEGAALPANLREQK